MIERVKSPTAVPIDGAHKAIPFSDDDFVKDSRPTLLFAAIYAPTYNSDYMVRGFEKAGYNVCVIDWQKLRFNEGVQGMRQRLIVKAEMEQPELIFLHIQNKDVLDKDTVIALQKVAPVVSYNFDCRIYEEMNWAYELAPFMELSLFSNLEDVQRCNHLGIKNVAVLQSSADYNHYKPVKLTGSQLADYNHDIVFIGNKFDKSNMKFDKAAERTEMVEFLKEQYGDRFKAWGIGFSRMVNQQEEQIIYNAAKIAITQNNFLRTSYCSDRVYRAMGCGTLTIQQYYPNINRAFTPQVTSTWLDFEMLKAEIDKYLENDTLRFAKGRAGADFVREKHSWYNRVLEMKELLKAVNKSNAKK